MICFLIPNNSKKIDFEFWIDMVHGRNVIYYACIVRIAYLPSRGIHTLDFSRKTTNAVLSDLRIVDVVK